MNEKLTTLTTQLLQELELELDKKPKGERYGMLVSVRRELYKFKQQMENKYYE